MKDFNITIVYDEDLQEVHFTNNEDIYNTCSYWIRNENDLMESIKDYLKRIKESGKGEKYDN